MSGILVFLKIPRPPRPTRTDTLFPDTTLFLSIKGIDFSDLSSSEAQNMNPFYPCSEQSAHIRPVRYRRRRLHFCGHILFRSEEHTSELQTLLRISYAVVCLKKKERSTHRKPVENAHKL